MDEALGEVGQLGLKDKQTAFFVVSSPADGLADKDTIRCAVQQPETLLCIGVAAGDIGPEPIHIQQLGRYAKSSDGLFDHSIQIDFI